MLDRGIVLGDLGDSESNLTRCLGFGEEINLCFLASPIPFCFTCF